MQQYINLVSPWPHGPCSQHCFMLHYTLLHRLLLSLLRFVRTIFRTVTDHNIVIKVYFIFDPLPRLRLHNSTLIPLGSDPSQICFRSLIRCPGSVPVLVHCCSPRQPLISSTTTDLDFVVMWLLGISHTLVIISLCAVLWIITESVVFDPDSL